MKYTLFLKPKETVSKSNMEASVNPGRVSLEEEERWHNHSKILVSIGLNRSPLFRPIYRAVFLFSEERIYVPFVQVLFICTKIGFHLHGSPKPFTNFFALIN